MKLKFMVWHLVRTFTCSVWECRYSISICSFTHSFYNTMPLLHLTVSLKNGTPLPGVTWKGAIWDIIADNCIFYKFCKFRCGIYLNMNLYVLQVCQVHFIWSLTLQSWIGNFVICFLLCVPSLMPSWHKSLRVHVLLNQFHLLDSLMNKLSYLPSLRIVWDLGEFNL